MRPKKREYVWLQMQRLAAAGLGESDAYSERRDTFHLRRNHPSAVLLTTNPGEGDIIRFVRADPGGLLFRGAADTLLRRLPMYLLDRAMSSWKGLEFRWTQINDNDIRQLFDVVLAMAGSLPAIPPLSTPSAWTATAPVTSSANRPSQISDTNHPLEQRLRPLLEPIAGQWLRPWMTALADPATAEVFIVGQNQAKTYPVNRLSQERYLDSLFNRNGESCRALYDELTEGRASSTRRNADTLANDLSFARVLETNVVCYSTRRAADMADPAHAQGVAQGAQILPTLLDAIRPKVLILYGAGTVSLAQRHLRGVPPLAEPATATQIVPVAVDLDPFGDRFTVQVIVIPSLSPPRFNQWIGWWPDARRKLASLVRSLVDDQRV